MYVGRQCRSECVHDKPNQTKNGQAGCDAMKAWLNSSLMPMISNSNNWNNEILIANT